MLKIGALVSGGGTNLQAILDAVASGEIPQAKVVTVVSSNPNAYALKRAQENKIDSICIRKKSFATEEEFENTLIEHFQSYGVDLILMAGYMVVIGSKFIKAYENRIMNIHPSLIPSFCGNGFYGLKVHEAVLEKGVKITGATVHFVTEQTDAGPIILQKAVEVLDEDTPEALQKRVMEQAEWVIYPQAVKLFVQNKLKIANNKVYLCK